MMKPTIVLTLVLALAACGSTGTTDPDTPVSAPASANPLPGAPEPPAPQPAPVAVTPGLANVRPIQWQDAVADGRTVTLIFYTGLAECTGLDHIDVEEGPDEITITLSAGTVPGSGACAEIAVLASTTVTLDAPVGSRAIVDGAA